MRKPRFYAKLAAGNLWRNRASYLPYLLACVTSIFTVYCLWAITNGGSLSNLPYTVYVESFTMLGGVITALFCSVLLFWTNAYLIKRRKKELALYSILGMEKRNIAIVMLFETLFVALLALVLGILSGLLLSRLLFAAMLRLIQQPVDVPLNFSWSSVVQTVAFFGVIFLLILLRNLRQVGMATPTSMLAGEKQGEREPRASWLVTLLGVGCIGFGYYLALTTKNPARALFVFLGAALLVIIGTYCLFTSCSIAVLKLLRRKKSYYYTPKHFISVSGMLYRMKRNAAGLASICILSCMVLVTLSSTVSLYAGSEESVKVQYIYEYSVAINDPEIIDGAVAHLENAAAVHGITMVDYGVEGTYRQPVDAAGGRISPAADVNGEAVKMLYLHTLLEYNQVNLADETLAEGELLLFYSDGFDYGPVQAAGNRLEVYGESHPVRTVQTLGRRQLGYQEMDGVIHLVARDADAVNAILDRYIALVGATGEEEWIASIKSPQYTVAFDAEGSDVAIAAFDMDFVRLKNELYPEAGRLYVYSQSEMMQEWYAMNGGFLFLGIYFGIMFLLAAALIIYYKQVSEGYEDRERFDILQKVGMSEREVKKTINSQIRTVFYLPLLVAVVHILVATVLVQRVMVIFGVLNVGLLFAATGVTILAYALVYLFVYRRTAHTYFRLVRRAA